MDLHTLEALIRTAAVPVVLLEGRRAIPRSLARQATALGNMLARRFPQARFRSGNAPGADQAFALGVAEVDVSRLQVVAPYRAHRKGERLAGAVYASLEILPDEEQQLIAEQTITATPANRRLIENRHRKGPLAAKARYLMRDTMKVTGHSGDFPKPVAALFWVDPQAPFAGGTGHTIRVCQQEQVPYVFQEFWLEWLDKGGRGVL